MQAKFILTIIIFTSTVSSPAQNTEDSLMQVIRSAATTKQQKTEAFQAITQLLVTKDFYKAIELADQK
jgi:hypothetical protein